MPATDDDNLLPFSLPMIGKKKITAAFDGGTISSDGGVLLLAGADRAVSGNAYATTAVAGYDAAANRQ